VTIGRDQLRALAVLRYWFGDLEVLAVLEHEGVRGVEGGGAPPDGQPTQLALSIPDRQPSTDHPSRLA
jgi:hypothetical protein